MLKKLNLIVRHFSPAWFAASMGTGGLANLLYQLKGTSQILEVMAEVLWFINMVMFILLLIPWILRWFMHRDQLNIDIKHPVMSNFFVTMPVAAIILCTNFMLMGKDIFGIGFIMPLSTVVWFVGII